MPSILTAASLTGTAISISSWTTGGINVHGDWKKISFSLPKVRARWIWNVRQYLLSAWALLTLPPVRKALSQSEVKKAAPVTFTTLSQGLLKTDPFNCQLCGAKMVFSRAQGALPLETLIAHAGDIARMRYMGGYREYLLETQ